MVANPTYKFFTKIRVFFFNLSFHISIQACRGRKYDWGVEVADEDSTDAGLENIAVRKIPIEADLLLAYSVVPGMH